MTDPVNLPRFRARLMKPTEFFNAKPRENGAYCREDLARSGLTPEDLEAQCDDALELPADCMAGYHIPYFGLDGQPLRTEQLHPAYYRTRLKYPEWSKAPRYTQPSAETLAALSLPPYLPYLPPIAAHIRSAAAGGVVALVEGEKKTAAVLKHLQLAALGFGGYQMWRNPAGKGGIHPWIEKYLQALGAAEVLLVPDADVLRYDICASMGVLAARLIECGYKVSVLRPPAKIDDWIASNLSIDHGSLRAAFDALPRLDPNQLVQTPAALAERFDLAFTQSPTGAYKVPANTSNLTRLIERSGAFPLVWRNTDNGLVYLGDTPARVNATEVEIANHVQHYFGLHAASVANVRSALTVLTERNHASPILDRLKASHWDDVPRLDTWMQTYWGVADDEYVRIAGARWLMASCARLDTPGAKFDWMLVTIGPEGTGKTRMPSVWWGAEHIAQLIGNPQDKDIALLLNSALCINLDELDVISQREARNMLSLITREHDVFRAPYAANVERHPRRCVLYGCGNEPQFLQDSGAFRRRFAIVQVDRLLDWRGLQEVQPAIWAEAWHRYRQGENWWDVPKLSAEQRLAHTIPDVLAEQIISWIESQRIAKHSANCQGGQFFFTMTALMQGLDVMRSPSSSGFTRAAASVLRRLKVDYQKGSLHGIKGRYYRVALTQELSL